jgi:hypothetical protein
MRSSVEAVEVETPLDQAEMAEMVSMAAAVVAVDAEPSRLEP